MENTNDNRPRCTTDPAGVMSRANAAAAAARPAFAPEALAPWLADLKRQIALRQAMP